MTAFASQTGTTDTLQWEWEARSVNGRGLDLRLRLADGCDGLEPVIRKAFGVRLSRGNVAISLKLKRKSQAALGMVNAQAMAAVLGHLKTVELAAEDQDLTLAPTTAANVLSLPGVLETAGASTLPEAIGAQIPQILDQFCEMRAHEGAALGRILLAQIGHISALIDRSDSSAEARSARQGAAFSDRMTRVLAGSDVDADRLAQEVATLVVKGDVAEELDRLRAHVVAVRDLLAAGGVIGRKLDFLMQEFNREANTLCSKSGDADLTAIGVEMKVAIEQMREQVQNVE